MQSKWTLQLFQPDCLHALNHVLATVETKQLNRSFRLVVAGLVESAPNIGSLDLMTEFLKTEAITQGTTEDPQLACPLR